MRLFLNTANPVMMLIIIVIIALIVYFSRRAEMAWPLVIVMIGITAFLIYHSVKLDSLEEGSQLISNIYHCIACDLMAMLVSFISYLWIDDIVAKKKNLKSYDDSLNWFWKKL